ncbi:uncharacterized protein BDZ99DRAFT_2114 [Mytilinidion resinicola]|uniref:Uncharacterized protein n=1 Tax=Mytilinidion resinicola TaxID=574789 RepID=A0A6A6Z6T6_9PEZI|nr:uncharacterized protein BDZ99DRAFT_2114 [Mytilinidion resinicola]KAF2816806.1 hypothetical protein BDZ99DRAFT_2114 [Mytilinidion resinicola]
MRVFHPRPPGPSAEDWVPILLDRMRGLESVTIQLRVHHLIDANKVVELLTKLRTGLLKDGAKLGSKGIVVGRGRGVWQIAACTESADGHSVFETKEVETKPVETKSVVHSRSNDQQPEDMDEDMDTVSNATTAGGMEDEGEAVANSPPPPVKFVRDAFGAAVDLECTYGLSNEDSSDMEDVYTERDDLECVMQYVNSMVGVT